ncbi:CaiB/BaiF CoA transferase family protein [Antricoccus suffuscus]|nr:CoA transferase [Antricoccus suffuscus]
MFDGLKVIDCASYIAAPAAATILSDFGADVIKVESPGEGDPDRTMGYLPGMPKSEHNFAWMLDNRNKRSLALDLSTADGQAVLADLVGQADVFITNLPLAVRSRLGIGYETLSAHNDQLIYASFTGYGERGDEVAKPGFDMTAYWARSGIMDATRAHAGATPGRAPSGMGDHPSAMTLFASIVMALYQRERTKKGTLVQSSLLANGAWANAVMAQAALTGAQFIPRPPREHGANALSNHYRCQDGKWLILTALNEPRQWPLLVECLGLSDLLSDPRFETRADRHERSAELIKIFDDAFATKDQAQWRTILTEKGIVFEVVAESADIPNDQQMLANGVIVPFESGEMMTVANPINVGGVDKITPRYPPELGEHSDEVLREIGYDADRLAKLRASGTIV